MAAGTGVNSVTVNGTSGIYHSTGDHVMAGSGDCTIRVGNATLGAGMGGIAFGFTGRIGYHCVISMLAACGAGVASSPCAAVGAICIFAGFDGEMATISILQLCRSDIYWCVIVSGSTNIEGGFGSQSIYSDLAGTLGALDHRQAFAGVRTIESAVYLNFTVQIQNSVSSYIGRIGFRIQ